MRGIDIANHINMEQNKLDYYLKKLVNADRIFKTADKHYTTDKKKAGKIMPKAVVKPLKVNIDKPKAPFFNMIDSSYRIDTMLERLKEARRINQSNVEKLDKMIEIWDTNL